MTNFEKYKDEILKITESNSNLAKKDGVVVACVDLDCKDCDFDGIDECRKNRFNWLYEEHDGCDGCKYGHKREDESPCTECRNNYMSKWERRPKKTRQDEFLKIFPNATVTDGVLEILPCLSGGREFEEQNCNSYHLCVDCRKDYWLKEVE